MVVKKGHRYVSWMSGTEEKSLAWEKEWIGSKRRKIDCREMEYETKEEWKYAGGGGGGGGGKYYFTFIC